MHTTFDGFLKEAMVANPRRNADMFGEGLRWMSVDGAIGTIGKKRVQALTKYTTSERLDVLLQSVRMHSCKQCSNRVWIAREALE